MTAKRIDLVLGETQQLTSGTPHSWSIAPEGIPVRFGVEVHSSAAAGFLPVANVMVDYAVTLTAPGNVRLIDESGSCGGPCSFSLTGGRTVFGFSTGYLDERLVPGAYEAAVTYNGNNMQATSWHLEIL